MPLYDLFFLVPFLPGFLFVCLFFVFYLPVATLIFRIPFDVFMMFLSIILCIPIVLYVYKLSQFMVSTF